MEIFKGGSRSEAVDPQDRRLICADALASLQLIDWMDVLKPVSIASLVESRYKWIKQTFVLFEIN